MSDQTDDLAGRLREVVNDRAGGGPGDSSYDPELLVIGHEAADEIERLQAQAPPTAGEEKDRG